MNNSALAKRFTAASLLRFALPNIIMMIFMSLYTIVDGIFISRLVGTLALSAVNMSFPLTSIELAIGIMLATGGSAIIARKLGEGKAQVARQDFSFLLWISLAIGVLCMVVSLVFLEPLLRLLGTSPAQMPDCIVYTRILMWFSPVLFWQAMFNSFFVAAGKPTLGLLVTVSGGVANMVLDYVFMGPLHMGVAGAALATGIGYLIPAVVGILYFALNRKGSLYLVRCGFYGKMLLQACGNGSSEMVTNVAVAITTYLFNIIFLRHWGEDGVAAITIVLYFQFVFNSAFFGFAMGVAPVISYKYGAQDREQLHSIIRTCIRFLLLCSVSVYTASRLVIAWSLGIFTEPGGSVYNITMEGFPLFALSFLMMGISVFASAMFTAFSNGTVSAIISFARTFVFLVGMLLLLPKALGEPGIWLAVPAAELLGLAVSVTFLLRGRKQYGY